MKNSIKNLCIEIQANLPKIQANLPKIQANLPKIQANLPKIQANLPKILANLPNRHIVSTTLKLHVFCDADSSDA